MSVLVEAAVESLDDALAAAAGAADRLELCANLDAGGTTPPRALIESVLGATSLPVLVMIRSRPGDFVYGDAELEVMIRQTKSAVSAGASGIVFGALDAAGRLDVARTQRVVHAASGRPVTFHRAIDQVRDPLAALDTLAVLGVARVLSSGGAPTAPEGAESLAAMVARAGDAITIVAGGGVRAPNVVELVRRSGVREVHLRCGADASRMSAVRDALGTRTE